MAIDDRKYLLANPHVVDRMAFNVWYDRSSHYGTGPAMCMWETLKEEVKAPYRAAVWARCEEYWTLGAAARQKANRAALGRAVASNDARRP